MLSHLTHPRSSPNDFLEEIVFADKPKLPHPVHIRFRREWLSTRQPQVALWRDKGEHEGPLDDYLGFPSHP